MFGLIQAPERGVGRAATLGAFAVAAVVLTAFVFWELHVDEPMLDMHFFRNPAFSTGSGGMMLVFMAMYGVMFLMTQYFQLVLGYSPLDDGDPPAADGADHDHRHAAHARLVEPVRREPHGRVRHAADCARASALHPRSASTRPSGTRGWRWSRS